MNEFCEPITQLQLGIKSVDQIRKESVVNVTKAETYDGGQPVPRGLSDQKMGVNTRGQLCKFCYLPPKDCKGHSGNIDLCEGYFNPLFTDFLRRILYLICPSCQNLVIDKEAITVPTHFEEILKDKKNLLKECPKCNTTMPLIIRVDSKLHTATYEYKSTDPDSTERIIRVLIPNQVRRYLEKVSNEDYKFIGINTDFSHPKNYIINSIQVPPNNNRPRVETLNGSREHASTHILATIIKGNGKMLTHSTNQPDATPLAGIYRRYFYLVGNFIVSFIDGEKAESSHAGRKLEGIANRMKRKNGWMRGNIMGKRVNFSGRSVISGDPNIRVGEVGLCKKMAMHLTKPVKVTPLNIDFLQRLVDNGPDIFPGAKNVIPENDNDNIKNFRYNLKFSKNIKLKVGWVVERHIMDGDFVIVSTLR